MLATDEARLARPWRKHRIPSAVIRLVAEPFGLTRHSVANPAAAALLRELVRAAGPHEPERIDDRLIRGVGATRTFRLGIGAPHADVAPLIAAVTVMRVLRLLQERLDAGNRGRVSGDGRI